MYDFFPPSAYLGAIHRSTALSEQGKKQLQGVLCDVKNCGYNDGHGGCTATMIAVGPTAATTGADTVCATFKPKSNLCC